MTNTEITKNNMYDAIKLGIEELSNDRKAVRQVKEDMVQYGIPGGRIERILSNPDVLESDETDAREVALFVEQLYQKTGLQILEVDKWYPKNAMIEARQYYAIEGDLSEAFPFTLENVSELKNNVYSAAIDVKVIADWMKKQELFYNYDIQRQATKRVRKGSVIETPTVNQKNVDEIAELLLKGELVVTTLALNAAVQTSDIGEELTYNNKSKTLTINTGTRLDILDGFHRCLASLEAYTINPNVNFTFHVLISNYSTRQAQQVQAQMAKSTPIPKARAQALEGSKLSNDVIQQLRVDSDLRGKISEDHKVRPSTGEMVSYLVLADAIDNEFDMKTRFDAREVAEYLEEFFDYLIGMNPYEFLNGASSKDSLMSYNKMFAGYVALASEMRKHNIPVKNISDIVKQVDFSKDNPQWKELKVLDKAGNISSHANIEKRIVKYFKSLDLYYRPQIN